MHHVTVNVFESNHLDATYYFGLIKNKGLFTSDQTLWDSNSSNHLDATYYFGLIKNKGLFTTHQTLWDSDSTQPLVLEFLGSPALWPDRFKMAMIMVRETEVLNGNNGEIRTNCRVINSAT
ncbi:hypothetical protein AMTRI_Chr02g266560 [Amborella trichopoda]